MMRMIDKRRLAGVFRRFPWLGVIGQHVWSRLQARYSLGAVGVVLNAAGEILLLEHVFHPIYPWGLPGGWVGRNESPADTVVRELREETGLDVCVLMPLTVGLGVGHGHLDLIFLCRWEGGDIRLSDEILDFRWCDPADLPALFPAQHEAIKQALRLREAVI
jgi:ADP-ribose pyrophosphatase YjhB (NUDIX family)